VWDLIQDSSQYVVQLAEDRSVTTFDADAPDTYAQALVRAKARFEIVYAKILDLGLDVTSKSLGDLAISNQRMIQDLERLAAQYKRVWQQAEDAFLGYRVGHAMPKVFVKGADVREDPDFMNRKFSSIDGTTKSW
jgi:hypothetical protein